MKKYPLESTDQKGNKIRKGTKVLFLEATSELLEGLSLEDQNAINDQIGKILKVESFNDYGHIELEFIDKNRINHSIWVEPNALLVES